jgi:hypothetical protein
MGELVDVGIQHPLVITIVVPGARLSPQRTVSYLTRTAI